MFGYRPKPSARHWEGKRRAGTVCQHCAQTEKSGYSVPALVTSGSVWKSRPPEMPGRRWAIRNAIGQVSTYRKLGLRELAQWIRQSTSCPFTPLGTRANSLIQALQYCPRFLVSPKKPATIHRNEYGDALTIPNFGSFDVRQVATTRPLNVVCTKSTLL
jgi:hypothetical protein